MIQKESLTTIGPPVPELPAADVEKAQQYYRDVLGFEIAWLDPRKNHRCRLTRKRGHLLPKTNRIV